MSRVFLAEEIALGRRVVVKVLAPDVAADVSIDRFRREIQLAARLQQAQIVPLLSAGELNGIPYYTMPFVDGESLRARLDRGGALSVNDVINILRDVTRALTYAHERGVVHRDIKPDNVLLSGGTAVVVDFGIAKAIAAARTTNRSVGGEDRDTTLTQSGMAIGTPAYISPEQAAGDPHIDHRADIYSLGCMAYELLTGRAPFAGRTPQRMVAAHLTENPEPITTLRAEIPPALGDLVMQCLAKDPAARPQSASEIAKALDAIATIAGGQTVSSWLSGPGAAKRALLSYAAAFVIVAVVAKATVLALAVPDWVFTGALVVMAIGAPVVVLTALGLSPHLTWGRTVRAGTVAMGSFVMAVVAIMVLRLFGVGPAASLLNAGTVHRRDRLLVADFTAGQDSLLSHAVTEAVRTNLGQSTVISIMPPAAVASALRRMERAPSAALDLSLAREIAERDGAKAIVTGSLTPLGAGYLVSIRLVSADSGGDLAGYSKSVDGPSALMDAIDELTRKLRGRIGESLKVVRDAPPLDQVTTRSLEALRLYAEAVRAFEMAADYPKAARLLREAVAKDTTFAMAYRKLGVALRSAGMPHAQSDSALTQAYRFSDRLPDKERYLTVATYYGAGPGLDRQKEAEALDRTVAIDSTDPTVIMNLAGNLRSRRLFARAESLYAMVNATPRASQLSIVNQAATFLAQGKVTQAESTYREAARRFPASGIAQVYQSIFLHIRGEIDSAETFWRARLASADPIVRLSALSALSYYATLRGRVRDTRRLRAQLHAANTAGAWSSPIDDSLTSAALQIWLLEQPEQGARTLDAVLARTEMRSLSIEERSYFEFAKYYAWAGRTDRARAVLAQYDAEVRDPQSRRSFEPGRHGALGQILLAEKRPLQAVAEIWASDSLPDGPADECAHCIYFDLGRAYDLANQPDSAISYWERYIGDPSLRSPDRDELILAGIYKRLGELYDANGDVPRAISNYSRFVELWKNVDPELQPKVQTVRARLALLQSRKGG